MKYISIFGKEFYICNSKERDRIADSLIWGSIYADNWIRGLNLDESFADVKERTYKRKEMIDLSLREL